MKTPIGDESVFAEAAKLSSKSRAAYLDKACGSDTERRNRIEALLHEHDNPDSVFDRTEVHVSPRQERSQCVPQSLGDFEIIRELGRGGMGVVYKARDTRLEREVAIKVLRETAPEVAARLEDEAKTAATLNHPGIVTIFDFEAGFGGYFIAMEFVPGEALDQVVRSARQRISSNIHVILTRLADAVGYAHHHRIIHRDLKPANILLTPEYEVKVLDFGIAARLDLTSGRDLRIYGTPYYMAPEQIRGKRPTPATDIYSFGATAFHLATGRPPFNEGSIVDAHLRKAPPDPLDLEPQLDPRLSELILRCLEKEPSARFNTGAELHRALVALRV